DDDRQRVIGDADIEDLAVCAGFLHDEVVSADIDERLAGAIGDDRQRKAAGAGLRTWRRACLEDKDERGRDGQRARHWKHAAWHYRFGGYASVIVVSGSRLPR